MKNSTFAIWCVCLMVALSCGKSEIPNNHSHKPTSNPTPLHLTPSVVYREIMKEEIKFADIVLRQAILETGWFTSYNCLVRNNLFGMKGGVKCSENPNGYKIYDNWIQSIRAYKRWQRHNYGDSDQNYYEFLKGIGYAESPNYIEKLKSINIVIVCKQ